MTCEIFVAVLNLSGTQYGSTLISRGFQLVFLISGQRLPHATNADTCSSWAGGENPKIRHLHSNIREVIGLWPRCIFPHVTHLIHMGANMVSQDNYVVRKVKESTPYCARFDIVLRIPGQVSIH